MQMMRLSDRITRPGAVTQIRPSAKMIEAMRSVEPGDRQPSFMQADHLASRRDNHGTAAQDDLWLGYVGRLTDDLDVDAFARAFTRWGQRHGVMHGWFTHDDARPTGFARHDLPPEELHFVAADVGHPATAAETSDLLMQVFREACYPIGQVAYTAAIIREDDVDAGEPGTLLALALDHSYTDGFSLYLVQHELGELYREETGGEAAQLFPVGDFMDFAQTERARAEGAGVEHPAVMAWAGFWLSGNQDLGRFPLPLGIELDTPRQLVQHEEVLLESAEHDRLDAVARSLDVSGPSVLYAAAALAAKQLGDAETFRFVNPVHTRDAPEWLLAAGWFITVIPIHIDIEDQDDLWSLAAKVRVAFREMKSVSGLPAVRVHQLIKEHLGMDPSEVADHNLFSYMDVRAVPGADVWDRTEATIVTGAGESTNVSQWIFRQPARTTVQATLPDTPESIASTTAFYGRMGEILRTAAALPLEASA